MYWSIHAYTRVERFKVIVRSGCVLVVTELFNIVVRDFDAKKTSRCNRVLVVTELITSGTQCILGVGLWMGIVDSKTELEGHI